MYDLNLGYEGSKKRRIVNQAECEQDLKEFLNSLFSSVHDGISKFRSSLQKKLDSMKIDNPEDLINIIEAEKNKRKEY